MRTVPITREFLEANIDSFIQLINGWSYSSWQKENFLYELPKKWNFSFALYSDEDPVGFCIASNKIKEAYYIHLFFVSERFRGKSAGAAMITKAKKIALANNIHAIELRCPESNSKAIDFYLNNCFEIMSKLKDETSGPEADFYLRLRF